MYSGTNAVQKNNEKHEKTAKLLLFTVFLRAEKQKPLQIPWFFEGQVAKNTVIYSVFFNQRQKTLVFTMFSFTP